MRPVAPEALQAAAAALAAVDNMSAPWLKNELKEKGMMISTNQNGKHRPDDKPKLKLRLRLLLRAEDTWRFDDDVAQHGAAHNAALPARLAAAIALVGAPAV